MNNGSKDRPNWLLRGFIGISLVIHFFVFLHISGIYQNAAVAYIELSMYQFSKPNIRHIPTPRHRQKQNVVSEVRAVKPKSFTIPKFKIETIRTDRMDQTFEQISTPEIPDGLDTSGMAVTGISAAGQVPEAPPHHEQVEYTNPKEYFEMLNLRIHSAKKYPESARSRHLEGRVKVEFTLMLDGTVQNVRVAKSSRHRNLDDAAIEAIKKASPFPRPPSFIFKRPVPLSINILFELA